MPPKMPPESFATAIYHLSWREALTVQRQLLPKILQHQYSEKTITSNLFIVNQRQILSTFQRPIFSTFQPAAASLCVV